MIEMRDMRFDCGLLMLGDSLAEDRDHIENRVVTPSRDYIYLAVQIAEFSSVDVTISEHENPRDSQLQLQWEGTIRTRSGILQLNEIADDMSRTTMWSCSCGPMSSVAVFADRPRDPRQIHLLINPNGETQPEPEPVPAPSLASVRRVLLDITRPFAWGGLEVMDEDGVDVVIADGRPFATSAQCLRIAVRHRDDTSPDNEWPATAHVRVLEGRADSTPVYECVLPVPTRRLTFGDADGTDTVITERDDVVVQVQTRPAEDPDDILIWLS